MKAKPTRTAHAAKDAVIKEAVKTPDQELKNFTFQLPLELHRNFKIKTASEDKKMKDVLIELINDYTYHK